MRPYSYLLLVVTFLTESNAIVGLLYSAIEMLYLPLGEMDSPKRNYTVEVFKDKDKRLLVNRVMPVSCFV